MKTRLRVTITIMDEYEADTKDYNVEHVEDMFNIDVKNFEADSLMFIDGMFDSPNCKVTIEINEVK